MPTFVNTNCFFTIFMRFLIRFLTHFLTLSFAFSFFFLSCQEKSQTKTKLESEKHSEKHEKYRESPLMFNVDTCYSFITNQLSFGYRVPNTPAHKQCRDYLFNVLRVYADTAFLQNFKVKAYNGIELDASNIIASFNPNYPKRILLAAHWDTRPFADEDLENPNQAIQGANDGASGVAVLLEIARVLHHTKLDLGIDIVLFDVEDYGKPSNQQTQGDNRFCLGSEYWAKYPHKEDYKAYCGVLLDMVGGNNSYFPMEGHSLHYAPKVLKKIWNIAAYLKHDDVFVRSTIPRITDDHIHMNAAGVPSIDILGCNAKDKSKIFVDTWHTQQDNIDNIDKNMLSAVGETVLTFLFNE